LRIEIAEETLTRLIMAGQVCAADLRCLDCHSKQSLWRLCLKTCINKRMTDRGARSALIGPDRNRARCSKCG
jgi:hypothetical protein